MRPLLFVAVGVLCVCVGAYARGQNALVAPGMVDSCSYYVNPNCDTPWTATYVSVPGDSLPFERAVHLEVPETEAAQSWWVNARNLNILDTTFHAGDRLLLVYYLNGRCRAQPAVRRVSNVDLLQ